MGLTMVPSQLAVKGVFTKKTRENAPLNLFFKYVSLLHPDLEKSTSITKFGTVMFLWAQSTVGNMLSVVSTKYQLSQRYKNHSLRLTSLQVLEDGNIISWHI